MKKTILGAVAALLCSAVFAEMDLAGGTLTFVNKLDIEPVLYTKNRYDSDLDGIHFSEINNTTEITFKTDLVDLYIEPEMYIANGFGINLNNTKYYAHPGKTYNYGRFNCWFNDYAITIKPFEKVWFGISDEMYTKGSYLPVSDINVSYGALGTDGFTVLYMPVEGLKITAGLPINNINNYIYNFGYDTSACKDKDGKWTDKTRPVVNSGVEYTYDESLCLAFIVNDLFFNKSHYKDGSDHKPFYRTTLGFYASFDANKWLGQNLTVNTGYTFKADRKYDLSDYSLLPDYAVGFLDCAVDLLSASVEWKNEKFNFAAQGQFRLTKSEYAKDMGYEILIPYSLAFKAGYTVNEKWLAECYLNINKNEEHFSAGEMYYSINPCATYTYNEHHKFRAGLNYNFFTDRWNNTEQKYEDGINNFYVNFGWTYTL